MSTFTQDLEEPEYFLLSLNLSLYFFTLFTPLAFILWLKLLFTLQIKGFKHKSFKFRKYDTCCKLNK